MKNIGIITLTQTENDNFGAHMQGYALIHALKKQAMILKQQNKLKEDLNVGLVKFKEMSALKIARGRSRQFLQTPEIKDADRKAVIRQASLIFKNHYPRLKKFEHFAESILLKISDPNELNHVDFIVGSDWVWHIWKTSGGGHV